MAESLEARVASLAGRRDVARGDLRTSRRWTLAHMALALRWGALFFAAISALSPLGSGTGRDFRRDAVGVVVLVVYGVVRTIQPLRPVDDGGATAWLCVEAALCTGLVAVTGGWSSPLLLTVGGALLVAGLLGGLPSLGAALVTVLALFGVAEAAGSLGLLHGVRSRVAVQRIPELAVMGALGAYTRHVFDADGRTYNRLRWMTELHGLLLELYAVAAEHPGLFTVEGAVNTTASRLREVLSPDVVALLLRHPTAEGSEQPWQVAFASGVSLGPGVADQDVPTPLKRCARALAPELRRRLTGGEGLDERSVSGLYAPILARGTLTGLLALERHQPPEFTAEDRELAEEIARHAGLAIDNARSFQRLRSLGADEERERIARELHDRVGQSLAAVAFNIDRIAASLPTQAQADLLPELESLSGEIRVVNGEIREKLTELRGGPTTGVDVVELLEGMLARVETRSNLNVRFDHDLEGRLPDFVEREIWRIGCEAIRNAERHSGGRQLAVSLHDEQSATVLEICDDGCGIAADGPLRPGAYGLVGMRERADLIGATLVIDTGSSRGTTVRLRVPRR